MRVSTDAPIEAFGGGKSLEAVNQATRGLAGDIVQIASEEKKKADDTRVQEAWVRMSEAKRNLQREAYQRRGKDAFGVVEDYGQAFDKEFEVIEKDLGNDAQREMARSIRAREKNEFLSQLEAHTAREAEVHMRQTTEATIAAAGEEAVLNYNNDQIRSEKLGLQRATLEQYTARMGMDREAADHHIKQELSKTHSSIVTTMLSDKQDMAAREYFEANKDLFSKDDALRIKKDLEVGSLRGESQRRADQILSKYGDMRTALAETRKITDPELRDETESRVQRYFSLQQAADRDREEKLYHSAFNFVDQKKELPPPNIWNALAPEAKKSVKAWLEHKQKGTSPITDWEKYNDIKQIAATPESRDQFLKMNVMALRGSLADTEFKEIVNLQASLRKGDEKTAKELDGFLSKQQIVMNSLPADLRKDKEAVGKLMRKVDEEVAKQAGESKKKLTNREVQAIVDDMLVSGPIPGTGIFGWFKTNKRAFEQTAEEQIEIEYEDIPKTRRKEIEEALKIRGMPVTEERVLKIYSGALRGS